MLNIEGWGGGNAPRDYEYDEPYDRCPLCGYIIGAVSGAITATAVILLLMVVL